MIAAIDRDRARVSRSASSPLSSVNDRRRRPLRRLRLHRRHRRGRRERRGHQRFEQPRRCSRASRPRSREQHFARERGAASSFQARAAERQPFEADAVLFDECDDHGMAVRRDARTEQRDRPAARALRDTDAARCACKRQLCEQLPQRVPASQTTMAASCCLQRALRRAAPWLERREVALCGKQFHHTTFLDLKISNSDDTRPHSGSTPDMSEASRFDDLDPEETREWLESIDSVLKAHGAERAHFLLERLIDFTRRSGTYLPFKPNTAYVNTISPGQEKEYPGDRTIERRIEAYIRWNAMAMVVQANRQSSEYGGHIASYASAATLYEVGLQPLLARAVGQASRRHGLHPGPRLAGHLRARVPRRAPDGEPPAPLPPGSRQPGRPELVSASVADAGLLAVPDRVDGPRAR